MLLVFFQVCGHKPKKWTSLVFHLMVALDEKEVDDIDSIAIMAVVFSLNTVSVIMCHKHPAYLSLFLCHCQNIFALTSGDIHKQTSCLSLQTVCVDKLLKVEDNYLPSIIIEKEKMCIKRQACQICLQKLHHAPSAQLHWLKSSLYCHIDFQHSGHTHEYKVHYHLWTGSGPRFQFSRQSIFQTECIYSPAELILSY